MESSNKRITTSLELTDSEKRAGLDNPTSLAKSDPFVFHKVTVDISNKWTKSLVVAIAVGLRNILYVFKYDCHSAEREKHSLEHLVNIFRKDNEKQALDRAKFLSARVICDAFGHELPERPEHVAADESLFSGEWRRFVRPLLARSGPKRIPNKKGRQLAASILQLKRCFPELPRSLMASTALKHQERLSKDNWSTKKPYLDAIYRAVQEIFPVGWDMTEYKMMPKYTMSNKACFELTRVGGGNQAACVAAFREIAGYDDDPKREKRRVRFEDSELLWMKEALGTIVEVRTCTGWIFGEKDREFVMNKFTTSHGQAAVTFVADPGKWRPVTKADWVYGRLKPYQKAIHGHLRGFDQFRLIGKTIEESDVAFFGNLETDESILSGDYEAATDNLHHDASVYCLRWILENMRSKWANDIDRYILARDSMKGLKIHYPPELTKLEPGLKPSVIQKGGQLMGSLLSFPVLCVINYAMWAEYKARSTGFYPKVTKDNTWRKEDFVLINGDDIGGIVKDGTERVWKECVTAVGLTPSLGKNYVSKHFLTLNSQMFTFPAGVPRQEPWVNLALLRPIGSTKQSKDLRDQLIEDGQDPLDALGKMHNDFVDLCPIKGRGSSVFIHNHREELRTTFRNLFGPRHLGGLGAKPVEGEKGSVVDGYSRRQLLIAALIDDKALAIPGRGKKSSISQVAQQLGVLAYPHSVKKLVDPDVIPDDEKDVTELIDQIVQRSRSLLSWLRPLNLQDARGTDFQWLKRTLALYEGQVLREMDFKEYLLAAPKEFRYMVCTDSKEASAFTGETELTHYLLGVDEEEG